MSRKQLLYQGIHMAHIIPVHDKAFIIGDAVLLKGIFVCGKPQPAVRVVSRAGNIAGDFNVVGFKKVDYAFLHAVVVVHVDAYASGIFGKPGIFLEQDHRYPWEMPDEIMDLHMLLLPDVDAAEYHDHRVRSFIVAV